MLDSLKFALIVAGIVFLLMIFFEPTRQLITAAVKTISLASATTSSILAIFLWKKIVNSHVMWLKHLSTPRAVIYPSISGRKSSRRESENLID